MAAQQMQLAAFLAAAFCLAFLCQGGADAAGVIVPNATLLNATLPTNTTLVKPVTTCVGYTDPVNLQAKLKSARLGEVITICSDMVVNVTLAITKAVTIVGNSTGKPYKLTGSLDPKKGYIQLFTVATLVGPVVFQNLELSYGITDYYGGAVLIGDNAVVDFVNVIFTNNYASYGGAVYAGSNTTFTGCVFYNSTAEKDGGAIYMDNGAGPHSLTVKDSIFLYSTAGKSGGAIYLYSSGGFALLTDSIFDESESTEEGGAVFVSYGSNATITYNDFINGTSATGGGAVYIYGYGIFAGNSFEGNEAPRGGAVYTYGSKNTSFCGGDNFTANAAQVVGLGDNVFVSYTPDETATSFCPAVPLGVVNSPAPYNGYSNASCANCLPSAVCDKNATGVLTPAGVNCTCNRGFYGSGYACYAIGGFNRTTVFNLSSTLNTTAFNASAGNVTVIANASGIANRTLANKTSTLDIGAPSFVPSGASAIVGRSMAFAVTVIAMAAAGAV